MKKRTADDIVKIRKERQNDPRSRYSLKAHEVRELISMAHDLPKVTKDEIKLLSDYFAVTQGTIVKSLENAGFNLDALGAATPAKVNKVDVASGGRDKLKLGKLNGCEQKAPASKKRKSKTQSPEEKVKELEEELIAKKMLLDKRDMDISRREREIDKKYAEIDELRAEADEAIASVDAITKAHQEEIEYLKANTMPRQASDPEAEVLKLYTSGEVYQMLQGVKRDFYSRIDGLTRTIGILEGELKHKEAEARKDEFEAQFFDPMGVIE